MENISKRVVDQKSGKMIGFVLGVVVDFESLKKTGYYVVDEESQSVFSVKLEKISAFKNDIVLIDGVENFEFCGVECESMIGKKVVSFDGQDFGVINGLKFHRNNLSKMITEKGEVLARFISFVGQDVVFVNFGRKKKKTRIGGKNIDVQVEENSFSKVEILGFEKRKVEKPEKINLSTSYYLGKVAQEDVMGLNNERVVAKGEVVTKTVFERAKKHNRINQLFFAVKREKD